jgi:hypothetical protein
MISTGGTGHKLSTYKLRFLQTAFAMPSIFMIPISPKASTSSMYLVMTYLEVRKEFLGGSKRIYIDAKGGETGDF